MAINKAAISLLIKEAKREPFSGKVLQIGRQEIWCDEQYLNFIGEKESFVFNNISYASYDYIKSKFRPIECIDDTYFFKKIGFDEVYSLDCSDFEGANYIFDLNEYPVPEKLRDSFDVIIDVGTIEHIFHLPNTLNNIFDMLKVGGRVIHYVPVDMIEHGFYNFSTYFFNDFYTHNNFKTIEHLITRLKYNECDSAECTSVLPGSQFLNNIVAGLLDKYTHCLFYVGMKTEASTGNLIPQQSYYIQEWSGLAKDRGGITSYPLLKKKYNQLKDAVIIGKILQWLRNYFPKLLIKWTRIS